MGLDGAQRLSCCQSRVGARNHLIFDKKKGLKKKQTLEPRGSRTRPRQITSAAPLSRYRPPALVAQSARRSDHGFGRENARQGRQVHDRDITTRIENIPTKEVLKRCSLGLRDALVTPGTSAKCTDSAWACTRRHNRIGTSRRWWRH
jgi:hypothetical protein